MAFVHALQSAPDVGGASWVVALAQDRQLARLDDDGCVHLPTLNDLTSWSPAGERPLYIGCADDIGCWLARVSPVAAEPPAGWSWVETRSLLQSATRDQAQVIACARQLHWWQSRHRFCGSCGSATVTTPGERALRCPACGATFFPSAFPAVIVAVTHGDRLLLAHNRAFRPGMFSLLAGFLDPGETFEQAAAREVREETGIEIGDIRYVTSQPWPFPNSIMAGFRASYVAGEIRADGHEILEAGWFTRDRLPDIPRRGTVARELIDAWLRDADA